MRRAGAAGALVALALPVALSAGATPAPCVPSWHVLASPAIPGAELFGVAARPRRLVGGRRRGHVRPRSTDADRRALGRESVASRASLVVRGTLLDVTSTGPD